MSVSLVKPETFPCPRRCVDALDGTEPGAWRVCWDCGGYYPDPSYPVLIGAYWTDRDMATYARHLIDNDLLPSWA